MPTKPTMKKAGGFKKKIELWIRRVEKHALTHHRTEIYNRRERKEIARGIAILAYRTALNGMNSANEEIRTALKQAFTGGEGKEENA